jgi:uncharacterized repeat protein (TIGR01451 family)
VEGLVAPGQTLTYTVQYENMGAGAAFGVFVLDTLASEFDLATLSLGGLGQVVPGSRTILWNVGELAPKGQPGSKGEFAFSVKLRSNLPAGTVVVNQAEVHFPSVPEITPTNAVVNTVQPLIGIDQHLQSVLGQPVSFQLSGFSATGGALAFQVFQPPSFGTLSGTPPNLTYTPPAKFGGEDHLYFIVSKGVESSQPAQVLFDLIGYWLHLPLIVR